MKVIAFTLALMVGGLAVASTANAGWTGNRIGNFSYWNNPSTGQFFPAPGLASSPTANRITLKDEPCWPPLTGDRFALNSPHADPPQHNPLASGAPRRPGADMVGASVGAVERIDGGD